MKIYQYHIAEYFFGESKKTVDGEYVQFRYAFTERKNTVDGEYVQFHGEAFFNQKTILSNFFTIASSLEIKYI